MPEPSIVTHNDSEVQESAELSSAHEVVKVGRANRDDCLIERDGVFELRSDQFANGTGVCVLNGFGHKEREIAAVVVLRIPDLIGRTRCAVGLGNDVSELMSKSP